MSALLGAIESAAGASSLGQMAGNMVMSSIQGDAQKDGMGQGGLNWMDQLLPKSSAAPTNPTPPTYSFNYQPMGSAQPVGSYGNNANNYQVGSSTSPFAQFLVGSH